MKSIRTRGLRIPLLCFVLASFCWLGGCGSAADPTTPPPLQEEEKGKLTAALPSGVTMESAIEPNVLLGPNSKTVGDALAALHARVQDGKIHDGGMGGVIEFQTGKSDAKSKPRPKRGAKVTERVTTIVVTGG